MGAGAVLAVALGAGGLYLLARSQRAPAPAPGSGGGSSKCDALESISPTAAAACRAASGVLDVLGEVNNAGMNHNVELNGPFASVPSALLDQVAYQGFGDRARRPYAGEHKNGCQPFAGAPGWSKCAAGTKDMAPTWPKGTVFTAYGTGGQGDPITRVWDDFAAAHSWPGPACAAGRRRVWVKGVATCCPSIDHRAGMPLCAPESDRAASLPTTPPGTTGTGTRGSGDTSGYVWVPANGDVPGHWERKRATAPPAPGTVNTRGTFAGGFGGLA
jgi:hypothetical protein